MSDYQTNGLDDGAFLHPTYDTEIDGDDLQANVLIPFGAQHRLTAFVSVGQGRRLLDAIARLPVTSSTAVLEKRPGPYLQLSLTRRGVSRAFGEERARQLAAVEPAFEEGQARRGPVLGDADGAASTWSFGGDDTSFDLMLLFAARSDVELDDALTGALAQLSPCGPALVHLRRSAHLDRGGLGVDHFGVSDLASQPGVRGFIRTREPFVRSVTARKTSANRNLGFPGQYIVPTGEFLLGFDAYPRQGRVDAERWMKHGSFLVARQFSLHPGRMHRWVHDVAKKHAVDPGLVAARVFGRWASGASPVQAPYQDDPPLGSDHCRWNNFHYRQAGLPTSELFPKREECVDEAPAFHPDPDGLICPFSSHARRMYPRDDVSSGGALMVDPQRSEQRRILRRSFSFGTSSSSSFAEPTSSDPADAGMMFLCYQSSIRDQFEALYRLARDPNGIRRATGVDLLLTHGPRTVSLGKLAPDGEPVTEDTDLDFATVRGGAYLFVPPLSSLRAT